MPSFGQLPGDKACDVLVIGGGMAGLLCAHALKERGADCLLVEGGALCGGITKDTTAKITSQHGLIFAKLLRHFGKDTARLYLTANEAAVARYRALCRTIDCDFETKDAYVYSRDDRAALEREAEALSQLGFPAELVESPALPFATVGAVRFPAQAQFHPLKFAAAIAGGLPVYTHTRVRELVGTTAVTDRGRIRAEKIIVATHFPFLNKHGSYFLKLYQQRSYVLALKHAGNIDGMYLDAAENGLSLRSYKDLLLLGGCGHRTGKRGGGFDALAERAQVCYPGAEIAASWATQDCMSLDGLPYIGRYSARTPDLFVATGFNKWGMTGSMVASQLLSDCVQGRENPYAAAFSPSRTVLRPQLAVNACEAVGNLLTPTRPRCVHLGCALKWNAQEHSWDCPCHGSRFAADGGLIDNPAAGDLPKVPKAPN